MFFASSRRVEVQKIGTDGCPEGCCNKVQIVSKFTLFDLRFPQGRQELMRRATKGNDADDEGERHKAKESRCILNPVKGSAQGHRKDKKRCRRKAEARENTRHE